MKLLRAVQGFNGVAAARSCLWGQNGSKSTWMATNAWLHALYSKK
jgi:hypothetical protein